jgi:radical SAM protein with 4Fe4S-binding SPASM domain
MTPEEATRVLREIADLGVGHVCFTGGEVLARPDVWGLIEGARAAGLYVSVVTNGTTATSAAADFLARQGVHAYLSIDGAGRAAHEAVRDAGSWEAVLRAAGLFRKAGVRFSAIMTLSRLNHRDAGAFPALAAELGASAACLVPAMPQGAMDRNAVLGPRELAGAVLSALRSAEGAGIDLCLWCVPFAGLLSGSPRLKSLPCRGRWAADIAPDGTLLLCDVLDVPAAGDVRAGFALRWSEAVRNPLLREAYFPEALRGPCASCPEAGRCLGGCFARAYLASGSLSGPDPLCPRAAAGR